MQSLSRSQARRVALAAQGFLDRPHATPTLRTFERTLARTGVLQVDSVNVLQRAHYMPLYSRMGPYDVDLLQRASQRRTRRVVEYWAHVQAFMPVDLWPVMRHRMEHYRARRGKWWPLLERQGLDDSPELEAEVLRAVHDRGPVTARDLEAEFSRGPRVKQHWGWNWSEARKVLDFHYMTGDLAIAGRNGAFEVLYDVPERVIPHVHLDAPDLTPEQAHVELVRRAARSHGVGTLACLADYYRMRVDETKAAVGTLVEAGELEQVAVEGWSRPAWLHRDARVPRRVPVSTLLSPFDPVVWHRDRTENLFDFRYRIEIYVPQEQRVHGYYVLPFLLGERIVARVDLKADRPGGRLLVKGAYAEPGAPADTVPELASELGRMAGWLGLDDVVVEPRGDLANGLSGALRG
jgi:uncharacterized protein YcaQ